ncbi:transmembrane signal receptor [Lithospermum erythrorhizon]|uniref:Transmembrane signal receptor n=1 Tax=Lithospermum erythrorhizon TaxID=34254 RepID=A0AAV3S4D2_LITER
MDEEINAMIGTNTWSLVPPDPSMNVVGCRWIFRLKRDSSGRITRRRARLVAKGNHQVEGVKLVMLMYVVILLLLVTLYQLLIYSLEPSTLVLSREILANMLHCKPALGPVSSSTTDSVASDAPPDPTLYRQLVGCLQYFTLTRPDLSYVVNRVFQHMHDHTSEHFSMVKRILCYVKATIDLGLLITPSSQLTIQAFSDADWAMSSSDFRSTGGYVVYLGPNLVSWQSKKQHIVVHSSTESEYKALANCSTEISWLLSLRSELQLSPPRPHVLWCDNLGATYLVFHARTKHIEIEFHLVRGKVARKELQIQLISTKNQIADNLTKPLSGTRFSFFRDKLRLHSRPPSACAGSIR